MSRTAETKIITIFTHYRQKERNECRLRRRETESVSAASLSSESQRKVSNFDALTFSTAISLPRYALLPIDSQIASNRATKMSREILNEFKN